MFTALHLAKHAHLIHNIIHAPASPSYNQRTCLSILSASCFVLPFTAPRLSRLPPDQCGTMLPVLAATQMSVSSLHFCAVLPCSLPLNPQIHRLPRLQPEAIGTSYWGNRICPCHRT